jgi:hypothetical protein
MMGDRNRPASLTPKCFFSRTRIVQENCGWGAITGRTGTPSLECRSFSACPVARFLSAIHFGEQYLRRIKTVAEPFDPARIQFYKDMTGYQWWPAGDCLR